MQDIINFIFTNKRLIIEGIICLVSIIFFILRKGSKNVIFDNSAYRTLTNLVSKAETLYGSGHGSDKMSYVIEQYFKTMMIDEPDAWMYCVCRGIVEEILSTPQKKK